MSRRPGWIVLGVLRHLEEQGEMTRAELARAMGCDRSDLSVLTRMQKATPMRPKRVYVARWVDEDEGGKLYPRAVFALGSGPDAPRPKTDPYAKTKRYRENLKGRVSSVFEAGMSLRARLRSRSQSSIRAAKSSPRSEA